MFTLPPHFTPTLRYYLREMGPHSELEFRFSTVERDGPGAFIPVCDAAVFHRVVEAYARRAAPDNVSEAETVEYLFPDERVICDAKTGQIVHRLSKRLVHKKDIPEYNFRMSLSTEEPKAVSQGPVADGWHMVRRKKRTSVQDHVLRYDFTRVSTTTRQKPIVRVSYEVEMEYAPLAGQGRWDQLDLCEFIIDGVHNMLAALQNSPIVLACDERKSLLDEYAALTGTRGPKPRFIGAQPRTLHRRDLQHVTRGYAASEKIDGTRQLLLISNSGDAFAVDRRLSVSALGIRHRDCGTLLDAELRDGLFHVFDVLVHRKVDLRGDPSWKLPARLSLLRDVVGGFSMSGIVVLKPHHIDDFDAFVRDFAVSERSDGLIFTPVDEAYPPRPAWPALLKWKPEDKLSIDFQLVPGQDGGLEIGVVGADHSVQVFTHARIQYPVTFSEGSIVECVLDKATGRMAVVRERFDKLRPNFHDVAEDVWEAIQHPVQQTDILSTTFHAMRRHHNAIKGQVLRECSRLLQGSAAVVLDLACGRGGDLWKVQSLGCREYFGVDVDQKFLAEATRRASAIPFVSTFWRKDLRRDAVSLPKKANLIVCNFALHYFWASQSAWEVFIASVQQNIEVGGVFACTLFDGMRVLRLLMTGGVPCTSPAGKGFDLRPGFDHRLDLHLLRKQRFGLPLDVVLKGDDGVILKQQETEYLVFADQLVEQMAVAGFSLQCSEIFPVSGQLDRPERHLCALNRYYVFRFGGKSSAEQEWLPYDREPPESSFTVAIGKHDRDPADVLTLLTGVSHRGPLSELATAHGVGIGEKTDEGASAVTLPTGGEASCIVWFHKMGTAFYPLAQVQSGGYHLRFAVPQTMRRGTRGNDVMTDQSSDSPADTSDEQPAVKELFLGRGIGRGKGCWTVEELRQYATSHGVTVPSSRRTKRDIVRLLTG